MSVFGALGAKNVLILFFSALSVSLLVLLLLFSFFFKNLNFSVKTKDLEEAPILQEAPLEGRPALTEESSLVNTNDSWDAKSLANRLRINVPKEAERVREILTDPTEAKTNVEDYYIGVETDYMPPKYDLEPLPNLSDDEGAEADSAPPSPVPALPSESSPSTSETPALSTVTPSRYRVYIGGFLNRADAEAARARIAAQGYAPIVKASGATYQVQTGVYSSKAQANTVASSTGGSVEEY
jgi:cell division septation protein DedD